MISRGKRQDSSCESERLFAERVLSELRTSVKANDGALAWS